MSASRNTHRSRRPLTARSVLLSVLLGSEPPRLPVQLLVRTTELFGIAEGTARTALSRMRDAGDVTAENGWYALASDRLLARQSRQTSSREARTRPWQGDRWVHAVVMADGRRTALARAALRSALTEARLSELREGVWLRPDNLPSYPTLPVDGGVEWFRSVPMGDPRVLASELWDLDGWAAQAEDLRRRMDHLVGSLEAGDRRSLADGFVLSADALRHFQSDPLLPTELLPAAWPGSSLRQDYDRYDAAYRAVLSDWFAENRTRPEGTTDLARPGGPPTR